MIGRAKFSADGVYRYGLERCWGSTHVEDTVMFVMLNPSTAGEDKLDPTVRRCLGFARRWGYRRLFVGNVYGLRSTDPRALRTHPEPVGPDTDTYLAKMAQRSSRVVVAWGVHASPTRAQAVLALLQSVGRSPQALRVTKGGAPCHPLYLPGDLEPRPYP